jgi:hypothetical protein
LNTHADNLRDIADDHFRRGGEDYRMLLDAARYIEEHDNLANECRRKVEVQIALRVEAQARAGRVAREARR